MNKTVVISQSNYIPWKGYFDMINQADVFVVYDDMQYTKRDWRNRNKIKTPQGLSWLSVPVFCKNKRTQKINETEISDPQWVKKHWETIKQFYGKAPYFKNYKPLFEDLYLNQLSKLTNLSDINICIIKTICKLLGINTQIVNSQQFKLAEDRNQRLVDICLELNAANYLSGPAAKDYLDEEKFTHNNITVSWMDYSNYTTYPQLYDGFEHGVTILDLIFNAGPQATQFMKSF